MQLSEFLQRDMERANEKAAPREISRRDMDDPFSSLLRQQSKCRCLNPIKAGKYGPRLWLCRRCGWPREESDGRQVRD